MKTKLKFEGNTAFFLFLIDISKKSESAYDSVQTEYCDIMTRIQQRSHEACKNLPIEHPWRFVFELIREQSDGLAYALARGLLDDHTANIRFVIAVYNAWAEVRPWRPSKYRWLDWLSDTGGWEYRIRRLVVEQPLSDAGLKYFLTSLMADIERLVFISNDVTTKWGS